jgi:PAS domain S-box-containing protein
VGQGERDVRLPEASRNELGELARVFNRMAASVAEREAALLASEVQFRTAFENANSGMCLVDLGGRLTRVNRKMSEIFGYPREELEGMTVNSLTTPEDAAVSPAFIEQAVAGQIDTATFEKRYTHRDGHIVWGRVASSLVRDAAGRPAYFISQVQDITARRQAEAALRTREAQLRLFVEHAPAAIAMLDTEMCYLMASQRWLTSYGLTGQIVEGRSHYEIFPEIPERWKLIHKRCLAGAVERAEEDPFPRVDGSLQWLRWEIRPWYAVPGTIGGLLIFSEDITERKRDEDALRASLAEQEALLKEVHHRVKNNLQVVASLLRLQGSRVRDPEAQSALQETQNRVRAMSLLHETLYRSESLARVSGERYLGGLCAQLLRAAGPPAGVGLRLEAEGVEFGLEQAVPVGLILNELVSNALKHAFPTGGPGNIAVTLERLPSHRLLLRVADTGVGCPPEAERAGGGTLGLELVRRLVGQLGGSLELGPGPGTAWSVVFSMPGAEESSS